MVSIKTCLAGSQQNPLFKRSRGFGTDCYPRLTSGSKSVRILCSSIYTKLYRWLPPITFRPLFNRQSLAQTFFKMVISVGPSWYIIPLTAADHRTCRARAGRNPQASSVLRPQSFFNLGVSRFQRSHLHHSRQHRVLSSKIERNDA